jgi:protein-S-isoprenylcysteine O-methyltransferase Ste14
MRWVPAETGIDLLAGPVGWALGGALLTVGVAMWIWARMHLSRADAGKLVTTGPFARVRHPHYAAGLWLLGPGVAVLLADWLALLLPLWMGVWLVVLLPAEEARLARRFGAAWDRYAARTPRLLPRRSRPDAPEA